jgi:hypothetical protein
MGDVTQEMIDRLRRAKQRQVAAMQNVQQHRARERALGGPLAQPRPTSVPLPRPGMTDRERALQLTAAKMTAPRATPGLAEFGLVKGEELVHQVGEDFAAKIWAMASGSAFTEPVKALMGTPTRSELERYRQADLPWGVKGALEAPVYLALPAGASVKATLGAKGATLAGKGGKANVMAGEILKAAAAALAPVAVAEGAVGGGVVGAFKGARFLGQSMLRPRTGPMAQAISGLRRPKGVVEEALEEIPVDTTPLGTTVGEMATARAATMAKGPRIKLTILEQRHRDAENAIRSLEAQLPQARERLEIPKVAEAPTALPGAPTRLAEVENLIPSVGDATTGRVRLYHGSSNTFEAFDLGKANERSLYGPGVYLTADPKIASGYARKRPRPGVEGAPNIQPVTVRLNKVLDIDAPADKELLEGLQKDWSEYLEDPPYWAEGQISEEAFDLLEGKVSNPTNKQLYRMMTEFSDPSFAKVAANDLLSHHGFDGITHIGGGITGNPPHRVVIAIGNQFRNIDEAITPATGRVPTDPTAAPVTLAEREAALTRRLQDQAERNEAEWFIESFDEQLGVLNKAEEVARGNVARQVTYSRGKFAREASAAYQQEWGLRQQPAFPQRPRPIRPAGPSGAGATGAGGNTQRLPTNVGSRAEAQANIAKEVFEPVEGSRIDEAATQYLRAAGEQAEAGAIRAAGPTAAPGFRFRTTDTIASYGQRLTDLFNEYLRGMGQVGKSWLMTRAQFNAGRLTKQQMVGRGADGYLNNAIEIEVPISRIEGLEPIPAMEGGYVAGRPITQPVEIRYDKKLDQFTLYAGNHRVQQAIINGESTVPAFVEGLKHGDLKKIVASDAFPVHPDFVAQPMRNIGLWAQYMTDPTRMLQAIDQGVFGGAVQRYILWGTRRTDIVSKRFAEAHKALYRKIQEQYGMTDSLTEQLTPGIGPLRAVKRTKMLRSLAGDVLEKISSNDVNVPVGSLLSRPSIARLLTTITSQEKENVIGFAQRTRSFFDDLLVKQNLMRTTRGQDPIPYIENYRPWVAERNIWSRVGFERETSAQLAAKIEIPDFVTPQVWFNPRAQPRRAGRTDYWKERDLQMLAGDYVETASKDIFYTNIIQNAKAYIKQMRSRKGMGGAAKGVERWIMESYAGTKPRISKFAISAEEKVPGDIPIRRGMFAIRKNLTRAVFPFNWSWNLATQTASTANAFMRYGLVRTVQGLSYVTNDATRREVLDNAYSVFVKRRRAGRAVYQDAGGDTMAQIELTPIEKAEDLANFITNTLEDNLTGISTQAARKEGESLGLRGRALWEYASEGGAKTQSMYNLADMPGLLRAPEVGALAPFQTFAFDMMNNVLEAMPFVPGRLRVGAYAGVRLPTGQVVATAISGTTQNRLKALARWVAGITAFAMASDYALGRQPWKLSSFLPFYGFVLEGYVAGNPYNKPLPARYVYDFTKAIQAYTKYGDWTKLRTWFIGYHALGGTQINRTIKGIEAVAEGEVTDIRGETLFDTEPPEGWESARGKWEAFKAITQGPYAVVEGRAYKEELKGGLVEEYIGDWPRAVLASLGTFVLSDEDKARRAVDSFTLTLYGHETNYFDLHKHPLVREAVKRQVLPTLHSSVDEYIDADYAERSELLPTQAFRDIRDALASDGRSGGTLHRLRKEFLEAVPFGWKMTAARTGKSFRDSSALRDYLLAWEEAGKKPLEIDYNTWGVAE